MYTNTYVYCVCNLMAPVFNQPLWLFSYAYFFLNLLYKNTFMTILMLRVHSLYNYVYSTDSSRDETNCCKKTYPLTVISWRLICVQKFDFVHISYVKLVLTQKTSSIIMFRFFKFLDFMHYSTFNNMY
jgi:hypothetical protein